MLGCWCQYTLKMKLLSLNIEGEKHYERVRPFIANEDPDVICLYEAPQVMTSYLNKLGYTTYSVPAGLLLTEAGTTAVFVIFASKRPYTACHFYYQEEHPYGPMYDSQTRPLIFASYQDISIATTHFTVSYDFKPCTEYQLENLKKIFTFLEGRPPHILCGDLNIARNLSPIYNDLLAHYTDTIPPHYTSSLDKDFHLKGTNPELNHLFTSYMVDHLLVQPPFQAHDVRLEFGVSDHAGVVAEIEIGTN